MELKDRVVIIEEKNMCRLLNLYGEIKDVEELSKIINRHLEVSIDEIEKDERIQGFAMFYKDYPYRKKAYFDGLQECCQKAI